MRDTPTPRSTRLVGPGLSMLKAIKENAAAAAFFDPQYKALLDKQAYGDTATTKTMRASHDLPGMSEELIKNMLIQIERVLQPSGHLFLWVDKFMLVEGVKAYLQLTDFELVDMITWNKVRMGMGYRSRRVSEYLVVLQKLPKRARGIWMDHGIPDVWEESQARGGHPHQKPIGLLERLIKSVTLPGDLVIDPCAGSFVVAEAAGRAGRAFIGTDLIDPDRYRSLTLTT